MRRTLLVLLLAASPAFADGKAPHPEGEYGGVIPGQAAKSDAAKPRPKKLPSKGTLSWIGFEAKDGGAQLFFQSPGPFEVSQFVEGSTLVVHLSLPRLGANAWRQIDTRFFDNPLSGAVAKQVRASRGGKGRPASGGGVDVRIKFKNPKDAREGTVRTATEPDGLYYVYLAFPPGTDAGPTSEPTGPTKGKRGNTTTDDVGQ